MRGAELLVAFLALTAGAAWAQSELGPSTQDGPTNIKPPAPRPDNNGVYSPGPGIATPIVLSRVPAVYPVDAPADGIEGECVLSTVIGADGVPVNIQVVHTNGKAFDAAAIEALRQSKFAPGILDGKPVPVHIFVRTRFFNDRRIAYPRTLNRYDSNSSTSQGASNWEQTSSSASSKLTDAAPAPVKVYSVGSGVTAPELIPPNSPPIPSEKCKKKVDGSVVLSVIVDAAGRPHNIMFLQPLGSDLDKFALQIATEDRFKPATSEGNPVAVAQSLTVDLQACIDQSKDTTGKRISLMRLRSTPVQKMQDLAQPPQQAVLTSDDLTRNDSNNGTFRIERVGFGVSAPHSLNNLEAEFTDAARRAKYQGICLLTLIVDRNGMPINITVIKGLDYGLSDKAIEAVNKYRFKPALRNGEPVPVKITVQVNFRLY